MSETTLMGLSEFLVLARAIDVEHSGAPCGIGICSSCENHISNGGMCGPIPAALPLDMKSGKAYKGSDGRWYHHDCRIVSRAERRRAGLT